MTDEDKAREIAHALIQGYIGPDHKVIDMKAFFSALMQALREEKGNGSGRDATKADRLYR